MNSNLINKLTGQPVSKKMQETLHRLENNEEISLEEIQQLPEMQEAYSCINNSTPTIQLKNREALQQGVIEKLVKNGSAIIDSDGNCNYNGSVGRDGRIDIVIGLPASGKSSALVDPLSQKYQSRIVDCDEAKKLLPEFNDGWGATIVHQESQAINDKLREMATEKKENIIYPIVGSNYEKLKQIMTLFKKEGYQVHLHFNDIPKNKALGRMLKRFIEQGRFLDPQLSYKYQDNVTIVYEQIKEKEGELINGYSKWCNDVQKGEQPRLIETSEKDDFFQIKNVVNSINDPRTKDLEGLKKTSILEKIKGNKVVSQKGQVKNDNLEVTKKQQNQKER